MPHELDVVRDDDDRAGPADEGLLERAAAVHVQVRRRLVEDQEVRLRRVDAREGEADLLAAGEHARRLERVVAREAERAQELPRLRLGHRLVLAAHDVDERPVRRNRLGELLRHVAGDDLVPEDDLPLARRADAREEARHRGLAEAVEADDRHVLAGHHVERDVAEDPARAVVGEPRVAHGERRRAAVVELGDAELARGRGLARDDDRLHLFEHLHARLHERGLVRLRAERVDEALVLLAQAVLVALRREERVVARLAFAQVEVVVAVVARHGLAVHLERRRGERAQQVAVVGDQEQRPAELAQELLHPLDGGQV